jgi:hypothetical protein
MLSLVAATICPRLFQHTRFPDMGEIFLVAPKYGHQI